MEILSRVMESSFLWRTRHGRDLIYKGAADYHGRGLTINANTNPTLHLTLTYLMLLS